MLHTSLLDGELEWNFLEVQVFSYEQGKFKAMETGDKLTCYC